MINSPNINSNGGFGTNRKAGGIDPNVIKFFTALAIVTVGVELVDGFSRKAAYILVLIIVLGLLLNNPLAVNLIAGSAENLNRRVN